MEVGTNKPPNLSERWARSFDERALKKGCRPVQQEGAWGVVVSPGGIKRKRFLPLTPSGEFFPALDSGLRIISLPARGGYYALDSDQLLVARVLEGDVTHWCEQALWDEVGELIASLMYFVRDTRNSYTGKVFAFHPGRPDFLFPASPGVRQIAPKFGLEITEVAGLHKTKREEVYDRDGREVLGVLKDSEPGYYKDPTGSPCEQVGVRFTSVKYSDDLSLPSDRVGAGLVEPTTNKLLSYDVWDPTSSTAGLPLDVDTKMFDVEVAINPSKEGPDGGLPEFACYLTGATTGVSPNLVAALKEFGDLPIGHFTPLGSGHSDLRKPLALKGTIQTSQGLVVFWYYQGAEDEPVLISGNGEYVLRGRLRLELERMLGEFLEQADLRPGEHELALSAQAGNRFFVLYKRGLWLLHCCHGVELSPVLPLQQLGGPFDLQNRAASCPFGCKVVADWKPDPEQCVVYVPQETFDLDAGYHGLHSVADVATRCSTLLDHTKIYSCGLGGVWVGLTEAGQPRVLVRDQWGNTVKIDTGGGLHCHLRDGSLVGKDGFVFGPEALATAYPGIFSRFDDLGRPLEVVRELVLVPLRQLEDGEAFVLPEFSSLTFARIKHSSDFVQAECLGLPEAANTSEVWFSAEALVLRVVPVDAPGLPAFVRISEEDNSELCPVAMLASNKPRRIVIDDESLSPVILEGRLARPLDGSEAYWVTMNHQFYPWLDIE